MKKNIILIQSALLILLLGSIFCHAKTTGNMIGQQSQNEGILVLPVSEDVVIDGNLSDWDLSGRIWIFSDKGVRDRYSVKISAMWDKDNLYLAARWLDPTPMTSQVDPSFNPENGWRSDSWQMRLLTDHKSHLTTWCFTEKKIPVMHVSHHDKGIGGDVLQGKDGRTLGRGIEMAYAKTGENSFVQEIKIPWKELYKTVPEIKPGLTFRLGNELLWGDVTGGKNMPIHRYADNMQEGITSREFYWTNDKAWGNATLVAKGSVEKRKYFSEGSQPKGVISVQAQIPANAKKFSIIINDAKGSRIRNLIADSDPAEYAVKESGDKQIVEVMWDGLDDTGKLVVSGNYTIKGLTHQGLDAIYEMSFYNPGNPAWNTADGTGAWGSDHNDPQRVARAGEMMIVSWNGAEGGSGIIGLGADGKKKWGERRGGKFLAADDKYVYAINRDHLKRQLTINRLNVKDGGYAPFELDGKVRPFELYLKDILGQQEEVAELTAITRHKESIVITFADGKLAALDAATAVPQKTMEIGTCIALASKGDKLFGATEKTIFSIDLSNGKKTMIPVSGIGRITDISVDADGNVLIADMGPDKQIKAFSPKGALAYTSGKKGGRPIRGKFDSQAMLKVSSIAVDKDNNVWAVENWQNPRRVSVWNPKTGKLVKDYIGNTAYAGTGAYLSDDPNKAYVGSIAMTLDRKNKSYKVDEILWVPDVEKNEGFPLWVHAHWFSNPNFFKANVNGKEKRFLYSNGMYARFHGIYANRNGCWQPAAVLTSVKELRLQIPNLELGNHGDKEGVFWNDLNKDAAVQLSECVFVPEGIPLRTGWGIRPGTDLSLYLEDGRKTVRYLPVSYMDDGTPVYGPKGMVVLPTKLESETVPLVEDDIVLSMGGHPQNGGWLRADSLDGTQNKWRYPNPYPSVHGSHRATMPKPGLLIGPLKILGVAKVNDDVGKLLVVRGNLGSDYFVTVKDGIYIGSMFGDTRLPREAMPATAEELYGKSVKKYSNGSEPFNGWFGNQSDGKIRLLNGMASQASSSIEITGLDSIKRFKGSPLKIDGQLLAKAEADNQARAAKVATPVNYSLTRLPANPSFDGKSKVWNKVPALKIETQGNPSKGTVKMAYSDTHLYATFTIQDKSAWKNSGKDWDKLFKTGDAVDIQLRVNKSGKTVNPAVTADDLRIVVANFEGKPVAVLMRPIDKSAPEELKKAYNSPVTTKVFDRVEILKDAQIYVNVKKDSYIVEVGLPLSDLGLSLKPGTTIMGDIGFITSDANGTFNTARIYWANKFTNLVKDLPNEAWMTPGSWGELNVE